jgi:hypothetical protein
LILPGVAPIFFTISETFGVVKSLGSIHISNNYSLVVDIDNIAEKLSAQMRKLGLAYPLVFDYIKKTLSFTCFHSIL